MKKRLLVILVVAISVTLCLFGNVYAKRHSEKFSIAEKAAIKRHIRKMFYFNIPRRWVDNISNGKVKKLTFFKVVIGDSLRTMNGGRLPGPLAMSYQNAWPILVYVNGLALVQWKVRRDKYGNETIDYVGGRNKKHWITHKFKGIMKIMLTHDFYGNWHYENNW